ncbi:MAG: Mur ligase domain-containing protein, partial [Planctomycetota bacterium]
MPREHQHRRLGCLLKGLDAVRMLNSADPVITGLTDDSRQVRPGALFVAVRGRRVDGHRYVGQAV